MAEPSLGLGPAEAFDISATDVARVKKVAVMVEESGACRLHRSPHLKTTAQSTSWFIVASVTMLLFLRTIFPPASSPSAYDQDTAAALSADLKILVENYRCELGQEQLSANPIECRRKY